MLCVPDVLTTVLSTSITPLWKSMPSPPVKFAYTSPELVPVNVNVPVLLSYAKLPEPPLSVTLNNVRISAFADSILSAFTVTPKPPTAFIVLLLAIVPPPVRPAPAVTLTVV